MSAGTGASDRTAQGDDKRRRYLPMVLISIIYLPVALCYSLMTKAWEANDELDHATYVEYLVRHGSLPLISAANGHESHQPPLYYLLTAAWQKLLGIPAFTPSARSNPDLDAQAAVTNRFLELLHNYTPVEHRNAVYLHELRLLSVILGLTTVLLAYGCGRLIFARRPAALATALTVALLPKQLVVDSVVTNDSLVITLCAAAIFVFLLSEQARKQENWHKRRWLMVVLGLTMGLALLAKENSGPLLVLLLALTAWPALRNWRRLIDSALCVTALLAVSAWWFVRNDALYGQFLASRVTDAYLKAWLPPLIEPVSWTNAQRFLVFVPTNLYRSTWYDGGWNQFILPKWLNTPVWVLAGLSAVSAVLALIGRRPGRPVAAGTTRTSLGGALGSIATGIAAVVIIAQTTYQSEARIAFPGLVGFAILLVMGTDFGRAWGRAAWARWSVFTWPVVLAGLNLYVFWEYLVPLRGL